jgi:hypothetical protein
MEPQLAGSHVPSSPDGAWQLRARLPSRNQGQGDQLMSERNQYAAVQSYTFTDRTTDQTHYLVLYRDDTVIDSISQDGQFLHSTRFTVSDADEFHLFISRLGYEVRSPDLIFERRPMGTCGGCGAYGALDSTHTRNGEECGTYV